MPKFSCIYATYIQSRHTYIAPVKCMLVTTVVLGSFSVALILLSPSTIIFSSDFAAKCFFTRVSQVKATCFQPKREKRCRKEVNLRPISFEIQLPEMTFKPISIADRNIIRQAECCILNHASLVSLIR